MIQPRKPLLLQGVNQVKKGGSLPIRGGAYKNMNNKGFALQEIIISIGLAMIIMLPSISIGIRVYHGAVVEKVIKDVINVRIAYEECLKESTVPCEKNVSWLKNKYLSPSSQNINRFGGEYIITETAYYVMVETRIPAKYVKTFKTGLDYSTKQDGINAVITTTGVVKK